MNILKIMSYPRFLVSWVCIVVAVCAFAWHDRPEVESSLFALLPDVQVDLRTKEVNQVIGEQFSDQFVVLVKAPAEADFQYLDQFANGLVSLQSVSVLRWRMQDFTQTQAPIIPLTASDRQLLNDSNFDFFIQRGLGYAQQPLFGPHYDLVEDPFGFKLQRLLSKEQESSIQFENGYITVLEATDVTQVHESVSTTLGSSKPQRYFVFFGELAGSPFSLEQQRELIQYIQGQQPELHVRKMDILRSGLIFHAAAGAAQGQKEISTIGVVSVLGIVLILFVTFRNLWLSLPILLSLLLGVSFGAGVTLLWFDRIHLISIAFGTTLLGVAIDYMLHLAVKAADTTAKLPAPHLFRQLAPGLGLSLISSIIAYAGIAVTPFPGLQQMAFFCIFGLVGAWVSMWCFVPWLMRLQPRVRIRSSWAAHRVLPQPVVWALFFLMCLGVVHGLNQVKWADSPAVFNTVDSPLIEQESKVQRLLGFPSMNQYIQVFCMEIPKCLERERKMSVVLDKKIESGHLISYQSLFQMGVDIDQIAQDMALIQKLNTQPLITFYEALGTPQLRVTAALSFDNLKTEVQNLSQYIQKHPEYSPFLVPVSNGFVSLIRLELLPQSKFVLDDHSLNEQSFDGVQFVDRLSDIEQVLRSIRIELLWGMLVALTLVALVLACRYRCQCFLVLVPPVFAGCAAIALLGAFFGQVNLLHLLGQFLVFGLGLDMGIMLLETKRAESTWTAIHISTATNALAFGLLGFCVTPALHHFGMSILLGLVVVWICTLICHGR